MSDRNPHIILKLGRSEGTSNYNALTNKPKINEIIVEGEKDGKDYSLQNLLIPGEGVEIEDNEDHTSTIKLTRSGEDTSIELTKAQYDALSEAEKMNGTNYFITDWNAGGGGSGGGGTNDYIWDVSNPASYDEIKAVVEAGERQIIVKRNGHYYYPFQYGVNEYPEEPELPCEFSVYFTSGTNYRYILNYQCDSDKTDLPMTAVVDRSEEVAAKLSGSVYSNIDSASSYTRFMNNELKVATGINNSTKEKLEFTFKSSSDQLVKKVPLFPEYEVGGKPQLIGSIKEGNTTYNLYQFYFTAYNLPSSASGVYNLSVILADYTVNRFTEVSGMQHNSVQIGSPAFYVSSTDANNKTITITTTTSMGIAGALLKITFMGSKN